MKNKSIEIIQSKDERKEYIPRSQAHRLSKTVKSKDSILDKTPTLSASFPLVKVLHASICPWNTTFPCEAEAGAGDMGTFV